MTGPEAGSGAYALSEEARAAAIHALRDYEMETRRYIKSTVYEPCAPACEHCRPRVAHFDEMRENLERRLSYVLEAIHALTDRPSGSAPSRQVEP